MPKSEQMEKLPYQVHLWKLYKTHGNIFMYRVFIFNIYLKLIFS